MGLLIKLLVNALAVFGAAYLLPGVHVKDFKTALVVAIILGLLNFFVKPVLMFLTFPITIITLGLFLLVINAIIIKLCANLVEGFKVDGWWWAIIFSIIVSFFTAILESIFE
ncbi:MAG TPA: phage holin family protein [Flavipsychrobacter sp.]|jgi:putative membrane protein|nr:phage holin family protein [Flavipsychrobacter sp.]